MFFDSQQGPSEGSKVGVAESTIPGRGSQNDNVRIVIKTDFTKNDLFISIPMVIIISFFQQETSDNDGEEDAKGSRTPDDSYVS